MSCESVKLKLKCAGIEISDNPFQKVSDIDEEFIYRQIDLITSFHKKAKSCSFDSIDGLQSVIGKEIERYKMQLKKLERYYNNIYSNPIKNCVDIYLISEGMNMLNQGNEAIRYIYNNGYLDIIKRSMNRNEICLVKCDETNLVKDGEKLVIYYLKSICYNLVEEDLLGYIKRLQKRGYKGDIEDLIKYFAFKSHLSFDTIKYLKGMMFYPKEFLKQWERYSDNKSRKTFDETLKKLKKAAAYEEKKDLFIY
ncbi:spore coat protein [Clostridium sp. BJN0001]|uniref:spore coat protein n=1 Tax=Clostridium sp. BJN0001 TaxID=2930219 RepID=UPI001FD3F396|nr:spore coat protein [Clostridium sp. BJN0001]